MDERWVNLPWNENYSVSDFGNVRSKVRRGNHKKIRFQEWRLLKPATKDGYRTICIPNAAEQYQTFRIHYLVLRCFVGERPAGMDVCHLNGERADNRLVNLKYGTRKENAAHTIAHGRSGKGEENSQSILTDAQVIEIRHLASMGVSVGNIGRCFNVGQKTVTQILNKGWSHLPLKTDIQNLNAKLRIAIEALQAIASDFPATCMHGMFEGCWCIVGKKAKSALEEIGIK